MKKINRFLLVYIMILTVLCGYMYYVAFYKKDHAKDQLIHQVQSTIQKQEKKKAAALGQKTTYGLAFLNGNLVIVNNRTKKIFEYTDMKEEKLPKEIRQMMKQKKVFENRQEVYQFLESYSS